MRPRRWVIDQVYLPGYCQSVGVDKAELWEPPTGHPANPPVRSSVHCKRGPPPPVTPPGPFAAMPAGAESVTRKSDISNGGRADGRGRR